MGLAKDGYSSAIHGTAKTKVLVDEDGYLVTEGMYGKSKSFSIRLANAENGKVQNDVILSAFVTMAGGQLDRSDDSFAVTWEV